MCKTALKCCLLFLVMHEVVGLSYNVPFGSVDTIVKKDKFDIILESVKKTLLNKLSKMNGRKFTPAEHKLINDMLKLMVDMKNDMASKYWHLHEG